jgi:hypothetical protein
MEDKHNTGHLKLQYIRITPSIKFCMDLYPSLDLIHVIVIRKVTKARCNIVSYFGYKTQYMHKKMSTFHFLGRALKFRRREKEEMVTL